jgi:hypothetical protein
VNVCLPTTTVATAARIRSTVAVAAVSTTVATVSATGVSTLVAVGPVRSVFGCWLTTPAAISRPAPPLTSGYRR